MTCLQTDRMELRPTTAKDRRALHALEQDPEVMRYLNGGLATPLYADDFSEGFLTPRGGEPGIWAAIERMSGRFLGWFSLHNMGADAGQLGYRLCRPCWGQGFGTEGACALIDFGFHELGYDRIIASTMAVNLGSRRVMEKAGMKHVRTVHLEWEHPLPGSERGDVEYCLSRNDWAASLAAKRIST